MSALDPEFIQRAAPPGSMRYFSLLYTPIEQRDALTALYVIDTEIRASSTQVLHDVAHTRLQWWRAEIDRLINRNAQHPATQLLQTQKAQINFAALHELMVAADMDLTRMTYNASRELNVYLDHSGGVLYEFAARCLLNSNDLDKEVSQTVRQLGRAIRRVETVRDIFIEARAGRIYWPLDQLLEREITVEQLQLGNIPQEFRDVLASEITALHAQLANPLQSLSLTDRTTLRPLNVLAALHRQLLQVLARSRYALINHRYDVGPVKKVWTAWRAARDV